MGTGSKRSLDFFGKRGQAATCLSPFLTDYITYSLVRSEEAPALVGDVCVIF
jgi:hypothetical protein